VRDNEKFIKKLNDLNGLILDYYGIPNDGNVREGNRLSYSKYYKYMNGRFAQNMKERDRFLKANVPLYLDVIYVIRKLQMDEVVTEVESATINEIYKQVSK
jgi:hypothetical protein